MAEPKRFYVSEKDLDDAPLDKLEMDKEKKIPVIDRVLKSGIHSPVVVIVVGMAGSGKSTLTSQLYRSLETWNDDEETDTKQTSKEKDEVSNTKFENLSLEKDIKEGSEEEDDEEEKKVGYFLNFDPATILVPFGASIDIRDTVDYKEVMRQHNLGPNGAIMTCLNLFATKFDQVISILEKRAFVFNEQKEVSRSNIDYILVDTPGQIEAFTWSASGTIFTQGLASSFPTVLAFVVDTPRCASSVNTFMSNMLYACSMLYRTHLPIMIVFNKIDVVPHEFAKTWMTDFDSFQEALDQVASSSNDCSGYYTSLTRSLSLVLDEFYSNLNVCGVSAVTGEGITEFWSTVDKVAQEFVTDYIPDLSNRINEQEAKKRAIIRSNLKKFQDDRDMDNLVRP